MEERTSDTTIFPYLDGNISAWCAIYKISPDPAKVAKNEEKKNKDDNRNSHYCTNPNRPNGPLVKITAPLFKRLRQKGCPDFVLNRSALIPDGAMWKAPTGIDMVDPNRVAPPSPPAPPPASIDIASAAPKPADIIPTLRSQVEEQARIIENYKVSHEQMLAENTALRGRISDARAKVEWAMERMRIAEGVLHGVS